MTQFLECSIILVPRMSLNLAVFTVYVHPLAAPPIVSSTTHIASLLAAQTVHLVLF